MNAGKHFRHGPRDAAAGAKCPVPPSSYPRTRHNNATTA